VKIVADSAPATKISPRQVAGSFFFLFIPLAVVLGGILAFLYYQEAKSQQMALKLKVTSRLNTQKEVISSYIQSIATDVLTVSRHHELRMMLEHNEPRYRESLAREFLWFSRIKKIYDQVRFLDEHGMERLRVNFNNGAPTIVPHQDLQPKGERYYFKDTFRLAEGEVFVSPFDLNIEHGQLEQPIKPTLRFGTPVFDSRGRKRGMVLLNYLGAHLLNTLKAISKAEPGKVLLLNSDGYFLLGPNREDEWGFMYENKRDRTFAKTLGPEWQKISRAEAGQFSTMKGMFTFTTIRPITDAQVSSTGSGEPFAPSKKIFEGSKYYWKLVSRIPTGILYLDNGRGLNRFLLIYAVMLVLLAIGCVSVAYAGAKRKQAEKEVRKHRDYLKELVELRTAELTNVNIQLQKDINERMRVELELRESEEKYRTMMEAMDDPAYICSNDFHVAYMNSAMVKRVGRSTVGERCYNVINGLDEKCPWCVHQRVMSGEHLKTEVVSPLDKKVYNVSNSPIFHLDGSVSKLTIFRDNTQVKKIEAQLQQAQKLESVGRLAGGVAHDYNNALSVIIGFTELALDETAPDSPLRPNLDEILKAAHNATDITRQLLAFARKQNIDPKVINLNSNVENMLKMLRRLIGEDIDLTWVPGDDLWPIMIDPSQVNQILANLCVNARDAIRGVGKISIETRNTTFDEARCADHVDFIPGDFVHLAISDDGSGMPKEILENIFEPFFTTKEIDKGTGLGLSTVYGIVKQNSGFINVYSEPGHGTSFSIYLPRHQGELTEIREPVTKGSLAGQGETILLVEDDLPFLKLTRKILHGLGYTILTANTPGEALRVASEYAGRIHLLVTDVIMPEMDGRELVERTISIRPDIKHMFMSGYTADIILHRSMVEDAVHLLHKPFSKADLAATVRKALDE
jgi:nitrogen-specific signal transduction histidine kinase/CheY-like chemotaxis protein